MNKLFVIGSLGADPQLKSTKDGVQVCVFDIAVNGRKDNTTWFRITAWRALAELSARYLTKGRRVAVVGQVSAHAYMGKDGAPRASLEVTADEIEFLSPVEQPAQAKQDEQQGFVPVQPGEELPF